MLIPNTVEEFFQKTPLAKLKSIFRIQPEKVMLVIRSRFSIHCNCNYTSYTPFPNACPKCHKSYTEETQQFHHMTTQIMGMVSSGSPGPQASRPTRPAKTTRHTATPQNFCTKCGTKREPGDKFCAECGNPY